MPVPINRNKDIAREQRSREQQAVLNKLRGGGVISGAQPANPIIGGIQSLFGGAGKGAIPTLGAAQLGGQEVLMNRGGWSTNRAGSGPINVGGQTWYPAQSGKDLVYKRAPGLVGGQYGSLFSGGQQQPPVVSRPGADPAAERAYQQEASRVAQLTAQDPELQRYEFARQKAVAAGPGSTAEQSAEDLGMKIWQEKYGGTKMAQPGGAVGAFNPLMQDTFGYQTGMAPGQVAQMQQTAAPIPVAPGEVPYYQGDLGTRATLETGYDPAAYGLTPGKIEDMKTKLLKQAAVNSASSVTK
jgi:hypothetical protein